MYLCGDYLEIKFQDMTLGKLVLYIGIVALVLTLLIGFLRKGHKHWLLTYLQNFCGVLFMFSGWVKAIDPMGTAFKMEQYFAEFEATFEDTAMSFIAPLFPWLSEHAIWFSVFMIILEIVVGALLVLGHRAKLTSWIFLIVIAFFTALTGFTYLTGYVAPGENFFAFSRWVPYTASNMRVTDCGCFGDFLKLEPKTSFLKDVVLLIPALIFVFRHKDMHRLFTARIGSIIAALLTVGLLFYCLSNFKWNEPHTDFRPFKVGVNIAETKAAEQEADANRKTTYILTNKSNGKVVELSSDAFLADYTSYPKEEWNYETELSEPEIPETKISHFEIFDDEGNDVTEEILDNSRPVLLVISYKLKGEEAFVQKTMRDSIFMIDSVRAGDSVRAVRKLAQVLERPETVPEYTWNEDYVALYRDKVNPIAKEAQSKGIVVTGVAGSAGQMAIHSFQNQAGALFPIFEADDVMLKTIMRSNPGLMLLKDGKILGKWHHRHFPDIEELTRLAGI